MVGHDGWFAGDGYDHHCELHHWPLPCSCSCEEPGVKGLDLQLYELSETHSTFRSSETTRSDPNPLLSSVDRRGVWFLPPELVETMWNTTEFVVSTVNKYSFVAHFTVHCMFPTWILNQQLSSTLRQAFCSPSVHISYSRGDINKCEFFSRLSS